MKNRAAPAVVRNHQIDIIAALATHLRENADADPHTGLMALILDVQGDHDELNEEERALLAALARNLA